MSHAALLETLGEPDRSAQNYTGELELLYADTIYRLVADRVVEITIPDPGACEINGIGVLSVFDWLDGAPDAVNAARFRISLGLGLAYDHRRPAEGSITVFERGRWDTLVHSIAHAR